MYFKMSNHVFFYIYTLSHEVLYSICSDQVICLSRDTQCLVPKLKVLLTYVDWFINRGCSTWRPAADMGTDRHKKISPSYLQVMSKLTPKLSVHFRNILELPVILWTWELNIECSTIDRPSYRNIWCWFITPSGSESKNSIGHYRSWSLMDRKVTGLILRTLQVKKSPLVKT